MRIIIDSYIPFIKGALDSVAEVMYLDYQYITNQTVCDADVLIVRTRTRCDEKLLAGSNVKFIASATIGTDHIDKQYCADNGITWVNAPNSNALAVVQYIASALSFIVKRANFKINESTIGIVGVGAVGSKVELLAKSLGMKVLRNDPPRQRAEGDAGFVSLDQICEQANIITFHVPLVTEGQDATYHLADANFFEKLKGKPILINAARGEVIDTKALTRMVRVKKLSHLVIDCWEDEPNINPELLKLTTIATPHIAGYSAEGKVNAAVQVVHAVSKHFDLGKEDWEPWNLPEPMNLSNLKRMSQEYFYLKTYDIEQDSNRLKENPLNFEDIRSRYAFRREPKAYFKELSDDFINKIGRFWGDDKYEI
ncbi:MAG: 4-phosphoerythronate dehydrogenase [Prevotellaceae bacterium]|jgi:erythronate-4-phosphate dehydrogenase|nr:4-phosphoerythronate dehydrogenase [Prevotellaceae bacterium]